MKLWKLLLPMAVLALLFVVACDSDDSEDPTDLCDGVTCEAGETCNATTGECEADATDLCADVTCEDGQTCNPDTGACEDDTDLCADVTCEDGQTCNPDTGECEGGGDGGACENTADLAVLDDDTVDPNGTAKSCMLGPCGTSDADCLAECVANGNDTVEPPIEGTGLSAACGACYGATTVCAAVHCLSDCLADPNGEACINCLGENCMADFCACAGYTAVSTCEAFAPAE